MFLLVGFFPICPSIVLASNWVIHDLRNIPGKEAVAIVVDRFGNKWIGTHGGIAELTRLGDCWNGNIVGLVRFSGPSWSIYNKDNTNGVLPHNSITSISISPTGVKWIGTFRGHAVLTGMVWTPLSSSMSPEMRNAQDYRTYVDSRERGWLAFKGGAARLEKRDWTLYNKVSFTVE